MCLNWNNKNRTYITSVSERHSTIELYSSINGVEWTRTTTPKNGYWQFSKLLPYQFGLLLLNGCSEARTHDLPVKSRLLYQLSYTPRAERVGFEPTNRHHWRLPVFKTSAIIHLCHLSKNKHPYLESNQDHSFRRAMFSPLNYTGKTDIIGIEPISHDS